jgi:hypothetical protein
MIVEKVDLQIFTDLHIAGIPDYEKVVFGMLYVCPPHCHLNCWMEFISILEFIYPKSVCVVHPDTPPPKIGALQMSPKHKMDIFSKNCSNFD